MGSTTIVYTEIADGGHNIWSNAAQTEQTVDPDGMNGEVAVTVMALASDLATTVNSEESDAIAYGTVGEYFDPMDFDKNGTVELTDALSMLKSILNGDKKYTLISVLQVLKAIVK